MRLGDPSLQSWLGWDIGGNPEMRSQATAVTWQFEYEDGGRSTPYNSEEEAWASLANLQVWRAQLSLLDRRPAWLVSSDGLRFAIPVKADR
jgi:hypothetical protein